MINLLPPTIKETYRYGRHNRTLRRWLVTMGASLAGALLLTAAGYVYLQQSIHSYQQQIAVGNQQLRSANFQKIDSQVTSISNNLKLVNQVLSKEILFSALLTRLGTAIPSDAILTGLSISQTQGGLDLTAQTASYNAATQLQINLADPKNQIFSKADIVNIDCSNQSQQFISYPCVVNIRALFGSNSPFLFTNSGSRGTS